MLRMSSSVPGRGGLPPDLARLTGMTPGPAPLDDLYAAVGAYTGLGAASPLTGEIVGAMVAAIAAARLTGRPSFNGAAAPRPRDNASRHNVQVAPRAWETLAEARRLPWPADQGNRHESVHLSLARTPTLPTDGQLCAVYVVDIVGFTRPDRDDEIRFYLHQKLYEYLQQAFDDAGLPWTRCFHEDRGDGVLIVIPPEIPAKGLIDPLPERLRSLIRRHNHVSCEAANLQLRAAVHIGPVEHDGYGFIGTDVNFAFRMLQARPLRRRLTETGAELGLVVSDYVHGSVVRRHPSLVHPDVFRAMTFQAKGTKARAWTYLPGASSCR